MTDNLRDRIALALCENALGGKQCPCAETGVFSCSDAYPGCQADAVLAEMRKGAEPVAWMYTPTKGRKKLCRDRDQTLVAPWGEYTETPLYAPDQQTASARISGGDKDRENPVARPSEDELVEALEEAKLQLRYIDERSPSGTTPAVIARIDHALAAYREKRNAD